MGGGIRWPNREGLGEVGAGAVDADADGAGKADGAGFFDSDIDGVNAGVVEAEASDFVGHFFDEEEVAAFDEGNDRFGDGAVVDSVGDVVGEGGGHEVAVEGDVDDDILFVFAFIVFDADDGAEVEVANEDAVGHGWVCLQR